ncbi:hypothetical protein [Aquabacterium sp.]|jgi:hypothetical protein
MLDRRHRIALGYLAAAVALALVFSLYFSPDLIVDLAGRIWSCF